MQGNYYRRTHLVTRSTCATNLVTLSTLLTSRSIRGTRLPTHSTRLFTRSTHLFTRSNRLSICMPIRSTRLSTCVVVLNCPLVELVLLSVGLFETDQLQLVPLNFYYDLRTLDKLIMIEPFESRKFNIKSC